MFLGVARWQGEGRELGINLQMHNPDNLRKEKMRKGRWIKEKERGDQKG